MDANTINTVAEQAQEAFWRTVAEMCPDIKTGDMPPDSASAFEGACRAAVAQWIAANRASKAVEAMAEVVAWEKDRGRWVVRIDSGDFEGQEFFCIENGLEIGARFMARFHAEDQFVQAARPEELRHGR